jgi:hypothetical protein
MDGKSIKIPTRAFNALKDYAQRSESSRIRYKNHAEDAETHEQVMDKRTRLMLYRVRALSLAYLDILAPPPPHHLTTNSF